MNLNTGTRSGRRLFRTLATFLLALPFAAPALADSVDLSPGDRVVLLGATFVEREVRYGCIETLLSAYFQEPDVSFRNLAWSGDTVFGDARAGFDTAKEGYERLLKHVDDADPTIILVSYGQNESFNGNDGLDEFEAGMNRLLDDLAKNQARIILVSPTLHENLGPPLPDPGEHNEDIRRYTKAIGAIAKKRDHYFVDMTALLPVTTGIARGPRTDDGMHFTESGYWDVAAALLKGLGHGAPPPDLERLAPLRETIIEKNRLFFNVWRAQNDTYIFGFRKYEQGGHAAEIPLFLPFIAEQEKKIAALRGELRGEKGLNAQ